MKKTLSILLVIVTTSVLLFIGAHLLLFIGELAISILGIEIVAYILLTLFFSAMLAYPIVLGLINR